MRVCLVSHRLGGFDGVSAEAAKWVAGFRELGAEVTRRYGGAGLPAPPATSPTTSPATWWCAGCGPTGPVGSRRRSTTR